MEFSLVYILSIVLDTSVISFKTLLYYLPDFYVTVSSGSSPTIFLLG